MELLESSRPTRILLAAVTPETGGEFKCEVSEGPPRFATAARTTDLQVVGKNIYIENIFFCNIFKDCILIRVKIFDTIAFRAAAL